VEGIEDNGFWCALGVTSEVNRHFGYDSKGVFTGYSGAGDIFSLAGEKGQGTALRWKSGLFSSFRFLFLVPIFTLVFT